MGTVGHRSLPAGLRWTLGDVAERALIMDRLAWRIPPWVPKRGSKDLDSLVMESRDRLANLGFFAAAAVVWFLVGLVVTTRDPVIDPGAGFIGAALIGLAVGLTLVPLLWLTVFGRHRQIAYRGDWIRAVRRSAWVGMVVAILIVLRLQALLELPIALFIIALTIVAEATLSAER
jgi:hypothetical protein